MGRPTPLIFTPDFGASTDFEQSLAAQQFNEFLNGTLLSKVSVAHDTAMAIYIHLQILSKAIHPG